MTVAAAHDAIPLELPGGSVPVLLFAGGTTGLVLLGSARSRRAALRIALGEAAEDAGLSALAFAGAIPGDAGVAAGQAAGLLERLGVRARVLVGVGDEAAPALARRHGGPSRPLVLDRAARPRGGARAAARRRPDPQARARQAATTRTRRRRRRPRTVTRSGRSSSGICPEGRGRARRSRMIAEAAIAFAIGVCGDGRRA